MGFGICIPLLMCINFVLWQLPFFFVYKREDVSWSLHVLIFISAFMCYKMPCWLIFEKIISQTLFNFWDQTSDYHDSFPENERVNTKRKGRLTFSAVTSSMSLIALFKGCTLVGVFPKCETDNHNGCFRELVSGDFDCKTPPKTIIIWGRNQHQLQFVLYFPIPAPISLHSHSPLIENQQSPISILIYTNVNWWNCLTSINTIFNLKL